VSATNERAVEPPLRPGSPLAPGYVVEAHLSRNQVLDVYEVWSAERDCLCVAKVLRPDCRAHRRRRARLEREGRLLLELAHPHLVRAYEMLTEPELAVVLETLGGERLDAAIARGTRRMPAVEIAELGVQLCSAVGYLHRHGWLHLDLKPTNVIVDLGIVKLFDLSLARQAGPGRPRYGTAEYLSPEQVAGTTFTEATDVFGLGCVLYAAATRRSPGAGRADGSAPAPVRTHRRLPPTLAAAIDAALSEDPADRPSVRDLAASCAALAACVSAAQSFRALGRTRVEPRYGSPQQGGGATTAGVPRHPDHFPRAFGVIGLYAGLSASDQASGSSGSAFPRCGHASRIA
jgi:eukaryotic-like serine/threonine-protein kinase